MSENYENNLKYWQGEIDERGASYVRIKVREYHGAMRDAGYEILSKYEENKASERHKEQIGELQKRGKRKKMAIKSRGGYWPL